MSHNGPETEVESTCDFADIILSMRPTAPTDEGDRLDLLIIEQSEAVGCEPEQIDRPFPEAGTDIVVVGEDFCRTSSQSYLWYWVPIWDSVC